MNKIFHIGQINLRNLSKPKVSSFSYEGNGLSVSHHPAAWRKIARLGGRSLYSLSKENPNFFKATKENRKLSLAWALKNNFLKIVPKFRVPQFDEDGETLGYMEFDDLESAAAQCEDEDSQPKEVKGYAFDTKGQAYWKQSFTDELRHDSAQDFAVIFFAEAHDFDGVWWNERLDVGRLSAPRGVIFQNKLASWKISLESKTY